MKCETGWEARPTSGRPDLPGVPRDEAFELAVLGERIHAAAVADADQWRITLRAIETGDDRNDLLRARVRSASPAEKP